MSQREEVDPESVIHDFFKYVEQYRLASKSLPREGTLFPNQQVRGLLIELALKTYLCAHGSVEWGHDLESLLEKALQIGLKLDEKDIETIIVPINHIYFEGGPWESRYICRYPKPNRMTLVTVTPTHQMVDDMVQAILEQALEKREA